MDLQSEMKRNHQQRETEQAMADQQGRRLPQRLQGKHTEQRAAWRELVSGFVLCWAITSFRVGRAQRRDDNYWR